MHLIISLFKLDELFNIIHFVVWPLEFSWFDCAVVPMRAIAGLPRQLNERVQGGQSFTAKHELETCFFNRKVCRNPDCMFTCTRFRRGLRGYSTLQYVQTSAVLEHVASLGGHVISHPMWRDFVPVHIWWHTLILVKSPNLKLCSYKISI